MKVYIAQIYIKPGVSFPFSCSMQVWVSEELSSLADFCDEFVRKYGTEFKLIVRVSADTQIADNVIKGPTVFKKTKDVEYTVFLPYDVIAQAPDGCRAALEFLFAGIRSVFLKAGISPEKLDEKKEAIIEHVCSDATMFDGPWPKNHVRYYH
jgi:hypothetical protein